MKEFTVRLFVIVIMFITTNSCNYSESLPLSKTVIGCYYADDQRIMSLDSEGFRSADGSLSGLYTRGEGEAGTFVEFEPAIRLLVVGSQARLAIDSRMPKDYLLIIQRDGRTYIRMPTEPLGERLLELRDC